MASLGTLSVFLTANSAKLNRELKKARSSVSRSAKRMRRDFQQVARVGAAAFTGISVATAAMVNSQRKAIDQLAKTADTVGVSVEALQELRFAASLAGVEARGLEDSLRRAQRRAGEFVASGGGPAAKAFERLGLSVQEVNELLRNGGTEALLNEVSDRAAELGSQAEKSALFAQVFGDDFGPKLVTALGQGSAAIERGRKRLRDLGLVLTTLETDRVEALNDALSASGSVVDGLAKKFTAGLAPALLGVAKAFEDAAADGEGLGEIALAAGEKVGSGIAFAADAVESLSRLFQIVGRFGAVAFAQAEIEARKFADAVINGPNRALRTLIAIRNTLVPEAFEVPLPPLATGTAENKRRIEQLKTIIAEGVGDIKALLMEPLPSVAILEAIEKIKEELESATKAAKDAESAVGGLLDIEVTRNRISGAGLIPELPDDEKPEWAIDFEPAKENAKRAFSEINVAADQAARNMQDAFADFLFDPFEEGVKGMVRGFLDAIRRMLANQAALQLFGFIRGAFSPIQEIDLGSLPSKIGRAIGGPVSGGSPYIVGERGPELFVPGMSGAVIPNHKLSAAGGGDVYINTTVNGTNLSQPQLLAALEANNQRVLAEVSQRRREGRL